MSRINPESNAPRSRDPRTANQQTAIELSTLSEPRFGYVPTSNHEVGLAGAATLAGDAPFLVPFRIGNADYTKRSPVVFEVPNPWTLDIDVTTINLDTFIGGIVDGVALAANIDYLIWAFLDEYLNFKGFGMTARPIATGASVASGGDLGASTVFAVPSGYGWLFSVGARLLARIGTAQGDSYNQGTITAVTLETITATMDALYTDVDIEQNTTLATLTGLEIGQLDNFAPRMWNQDSLYPGSGVEYQYSYLGSLQTDVNLDIRRPRKRGEALGFRVQWFKVFSQTAAAVTISQRVCLARWLPLGTRAVTGLLTISGSNVNGFIKVQTDPTVATWGVTGARTAGGGISSTSYIALTRFHNTTLLYELNVTPGANMTGDGYITGYNEGRY